jgi:DNA (cytosine-5)-methyltransferase 1
LLAGVEETGDVVVSGVESVFNFYEFFAGGGMVRAGLGAKWACAFANDYDRLKANTYIRNFGDAKFVFGDIHGVEVEGVPGRVDLAWASFPCQDLSCAGAGKGIGQAGRLARTRSGTFWPFVALMRALKAKRRAPKIIVLENVLGLLTTSSGADFRSVAEALCGLGYRVGAVVVDAKHFVPQSRPRLFVVGVSRRISLPRGLKSAGPAAPWHPEMLTKVWRDLPARIRGQWMWLDPGAPPMLQKTLADIVSDRPADAEWHTPAQTRRLISLMSPIHRRKLRDAKRAGTRKVATLFLRMRPENGRNRQRAEISFGDVAGCLRTPRGGGSRPRVLVVRGGEVRSRLLSPREAASLMGLRSRYWLPEAYEAAFQVLGDGVVVPAVRFMRDRILEPILAPTKARNRSGERDERARRREGARPQGRDLGGALEFSL